MECLHLKCNPLQFPSGILANASSLYVHMLAVFFLLPITQYVSGQRDEQILVVLSYTHFPVVEKKSVFTIAHFLACMPSVYF